MNKYSLRVEMTLPSEANTTEEALNKVHQYIVAKDATFVHVKVYKENGFFFSEGTVTDVPPVED